MSDEKGKPGAPKGCGLVLTPEPKAPALLAALAWLVSKQERGARQADREAGG